MSCFFVPGQTERARRNGKWRTYYRPWRGQYTQQLALMMAAIAVAAFTVSVITEVTKEIGFLGRIPTAVQVIVLSVVLCQLVYWWYVTSTKAAAVWWGPVLAW